MKTKMIVWAMAFAALGLVMTQNWEFCMSKQALNLDLHYTRINLPELPVAVLFLLVFIYGMSISSLSFYIDRFALRRKMKKLNRALESCSKKSAELETAMAEKKTTEKPRSFFFWRKKSPELDHPSGDMSVSGRGDPTLDEQGGQTDLPQEQQRPKKEKDGANGLL